MAELRLDEIARMTRGKILTGSPAQIFRTFGIDSRLTNPGDLFFAIIGDRDGHDYIPMAAEKGAAGAVVSRRIPAEDPPFAMVLVDDTLGALQSLAAAVLRRRPVTVVGITGSIGKTTTKEFTAALLAGRFHVLKSEGNFNNHLGLALSVLRLDDHHQAAVLEMGMSAPGEIRTLTQIAPPDIAVITNIGPVHLQFFDSLDDIALAKREILEGMKEDGTAVLNIDDPRIREMAENRKGRTITFGLESDSEIRAVDLRTRGFEGMTFTLQIADKRTEVNFPFVNEAYVVNLLAAAGVGHALGIPLEDMAGRIGDLTPFTRRGILIQLKKGIHLCDDSYNSNPGALEAALKSMAALPAQRKVAVLGDMLELGEEERRFHFEAGRAVVRWKWDLLIAVGPLAAVIAEGAESAGMRKDRIVAYADSSAASNEIQGLLREGDLVLVKGSRGMRMERIIDKLRSEERN